MPPREIETLCLRKECAISLHFIIHIGVRATEHSLPLALFVSRQSAKTGEAFQEKICLTEAHVRSPARNAQTSLIRETTTCQFRTVTKNDLLNIVVVSDLQSGTKSILHSRYVVLLFPRRSAKVEPIITPASSQNRQQISRQYCKSSLPSSEARTHYYERNSMPHVWHF